MNAMLRRCLPVLAVLLLAACAQFPGRAPSGVTLPTRLAHTCKNPNPGNIFREPDGGYHESFQGWFYKAEVHQGSTPGSAAAYCYYGLDMAAPANRPVYSVHYPMSGFNANQCSVSGMTVTCVRQPVLTQ